MRGKVFLGIWLVMLVILPGFAAASGKVALVIGNARYTHASALANPENDANAIAQKLEALDFKVHLHRNLGGQDMRIALGKFTEEALHADVTLVFYAGHGIELGGRNYLIPVDARMRSEATAQFEAVALDNVIATVSQASKLGVVLIDACRDNPFSASMQRNNGTRSMSRGLAPVSLEGEQGLLVSFAAEAGSTADDGDGKHSPYTTALLGVIDEPGLEVGRMFRKVRAQVRDATGGRQVPIERMQLPDEAIYFVPEGTAPVDPTPVDPEPEVKRRPVEMDPMVVYLDALQSGEVGPLADFLSRYPDHPRAADARKLILSMQDDAFWRQVSGENSVQGYRRYLMAFGDGAYADQAVEKIAALTRPVTPEPTPGVTPPAIVQPPSRGRVSPSFDCNKASNTIEYAICGDSGLAGQDKDLTAAYRSAKSRGWVSGAIQRQWIKERGAACSPLGDLVADCISQTTGDRINALKSGRMSGNVAPTFNCARAGTAVELAICRSDVLGWQDSQLLRYYKQAKSNGWSEASSQRRWVGQRESRCAGRGSGVAVCVAEATADRIRVLARR